MASFIKTLKDVLGNQILPRTVARAVRTEDGETVEAKLAGLGTAVDGITPEGLGVYTKEEVLTDGTCALLGLDENAVPDEALQRLYERTQSGGMRQRKSTCELMMTGRFLYPWA